MHSLKKNERQENAQDVHFRHSRAQDGESVPTVYAGLKGKCIEAFI
jgi:hypothetical protein